MANISPNHGISTLVNHWAEGDNPYRAHVTPIYLTSAFGFPDTATAGRVFSGEEAGYIYSRAGNPNATQLAQKIAALEGLDLLRRKPEKTADTVVAGRVFASGMAAISAAVLGLVRAGETIITQQALYGNAFRFFNELAPRLGLKVIWTAGLAASDWAAALEANPHASLVYTETPTNPAMDLVDLARLTELAHTYGAWIMVDNTFATPYHQRPLGLGSDVVIHSTTKYLAGHGAIIGGAIVSPHLEYMQSGKDGVGMIGRVMGGTPSPFDCWLANIGLKTFELRMQRHSENGLALARWLAGHPKIERVYYPGLETHPGFEIARRQMFNGYGGMLSFEVKGGLAAGATLMERLRLSTLAVSLGNVDSLVEHPASMTHAAMTAEERRQAHIGDGLVRLSVGIENTEDLLADMEQALAGI